MHKRFPYRIVALLILGLSIAALPIVNAAPDKTENPEDTTTKRVGGDLEIQVEQRGFSYFAAGASITTPLPDGYPAPTPPGAIEIKHYPSVRRAEVTVEGRVNPDRAQNSSFWPLFRHIQANGIAMTAPVEMEYKGLSPDGKGDLQQWTMAFLYRTPDLHPTGTDKSNDDVVIIDTEPVTVLSSGYLGDYNLLRVRAELFRLNRWLEESTEWQAAGEPRSFGYNDPSVPTSRRWGEVQIPIRRIQPKTENPAETPADPQPSPEPAR